MRARGAVVEYAAAALAYLVVLFITLPAQPRIQVNDGRGYDGALYYEVASQLGAGAPASGATRFASRLGTPWLAVRVDREDLVNGFQVVNLSAAFASTLLVLAWLRLHLPGPSWLRLVVVVVYASHWLQLIRFTVFYPVLADACAQAFCFAGLIGISSYAKSPSAAKLALVACISAIGVVFRESVILVPVAFLFAAGPRLEWRLLPHRLRLRNLPRLREWIPLVLAIGALAAVRSSIVPADAGFSATDHLLEGALSRSALTYLLGWMVAFGPVIGVLLAAPQASMAFFRRHSWVLVYMAGVAIAGWAGSRESERHALNWGSPIVYLLLAATLHQHRQQVTGMLLTIIVASQVLVSRLFWSIPQPAAGSVPANPAIVLTPLGPGASYHHLFPDQLPPALAWLQFWQHAAATAGIALFMWWHTIQPAGAFGKGRLAITTAWRVPVSVAAGCAASLRRMGLRASVGLLIVSCLAAAGSAISAIAVYRRQPARINVRWKPHISSQRREILERQLQLAHGDVGEGSTWVYTLTDASTEGIRAVVQHPAVEDTAHVDRETFRPEGAAEIERRAVWLGVLMGVIVALAALGTARGTDPGT